MAIFIGRDVNLQTGCWTSDVLPERTQTCTNTQDMSKDEKEREVLNMVNTNNTAQPQAIEMCTFHKMKFHDPFIKKLILPGDWAMIAQKTIGIKIKQPSMLWFLPLSLEALKKLMEESQVPS